MRQASLIPFLAQKYGFLLPNPNGTITAQFQQRVQESYAYVRVKEIRGSIIEMEACLTRSVGTSVQISGKFTYSPWVGNNIEASFDATIPSGHSSVSFTQYLSGSPSSVQITVNPRVTYVYPREGTNSNGSKFVITY